MSTTGGHLGRHSAAEGRRHRLADIRDTRNRPATSWLPAPASISSAVAMLRLAASLADQAPVSLGDAITGIDDRNVGLLVKAVLHASGRRQFG